MFFCPKCKVPLKKSIGSFGFFWLCPNCSGKALSLSILRQSVPVSIVNEFWSRVKSKEFPEKRDCPACNQIMSEVPIMQGEKSIYIDICKKCNFIWFDTNEYESLPRVEIPKEKLEKLSLKAQEALVKLKIESIQNQNELNQMIESLTPDMRHEILDTIFYLIFTGV